MSSALPTADSAGPGTVPPVLTVVTAGRSFDVQLSSGSIMLGRGPSNDVALDEPTVSLHHAMVRRRQDGWEVVDLRSRNGTTMNGRRVDEAPLHDGDSFELAGTVRVTFHSAAPAQPRVDPDRPTVALLEEENATGELPAARSEPTGQLPADEQSAVAAPDANPVVAVAAGTDDQSAVESAGIMIEAAQLTVKVGGGRVILNDVSLRIRPHEFVAVVGVSGAGKSTLLNALSGFRPAGSGEVYYDGVPLYRHFGALRTRIGYVPQDDIIHGELKVQRALEYSARLRMPAKTSRDQRRQRVAEVLSELGLEEQRNTRVRNLSGGERKRVNLGVELLTEPPVLFLDEPTSGLDPGIETRMMSLFRQLADQGHTVLLITHATRNISLCDKVLFLTAGGRTAFFGAPRDALLYFQVEDFEDIYLLLEGTRGPEEWEQDFRVSRYYEEEIGQPLAGLLKEAPGGDQQPAEEAKAVEERLPPSPEPPPGALAQFFILARRYAGILVSDRKNLALLILQAPVIAVLFWALFPRDVYSQPQGVTVLARQNDTFRTVQRDPASGQLINVPPGSDLVAVSGPDCERLAAEGKALSGNCNTVAGGGNNQALKAAQLAFFLAAVAVWLGTLNAIREISKEDAIYRRERLVSLKVLPYIGSKMAVLLIIVMLQSLLLLTVTALHVKFQMGLVHWQIPLHPQNRFYHIDLPTGPIDGVWLSLFLAGAASVALALAISAAVSNPDRALLAAPLVMVPQIMFAGGVAPIHDLGPARLLSLVVATRWGYESIGRVTSVVKEAAIPQQFPYADALQGSALGRWLVLTGFVIAFGALAVVLQRLKDRR